MDHKKLFAMGTLFSSLSLGIFKLKGGFIFFILNNYFRLIIRVGVISLGATFFYRGIGVI